MFSNELSQLATMDLGYFEDTIEELLYKYQPESSYWVTMTNVTTPTNFYVRHIAYDKFLERFDNQMENLCTISIIPKIDDQVIYRAQDRGGKALRGRVLALEETELSTTYTLISLDYGYIDELVKPKDIFECDSFSLSIPPLALQCELENCAPLDGKEWSEESIEAFKFYLGDEPCNIIVMQNIEKKLTIQLYNSNPDDMGTLLAVSGFSTLGYVTPHASQDYVAPAVEGNIKIETIRKYYFNYKEIPVNDILHVRMLHYKHLGEFYVAEVSEYKKYKKLQKEVKEQIFNVRELRLDEMVVGKPVLVREKGGCRAIIESVLLDEQANVCLVDCGRRVLAPKVFLKRIPQQLLEPPVAAIYCRADDLPLGITTASFKQIGYKFIVTVKKIGSKFKVPNTVKITRI